MDDPRDAAQDANPSNTSRKYSLISLVEFGKLASAEPSGYLLDGIIPRTGTVLVVGQPMAGKTRFMAGVTVAVTAGMPLAGRTTSQSEVAWAALEHRTKPLYEHFIHAGHGLSVSKPEDLPVRVLSPRGWRIDDPACVAHMRKLLDDAEISVLVIDTLRRAGNFDENRSDDVAEIMAALAELTSDNTRVVIGLHHTNSAGRPRGSSDFEGASDSVVTINRRPDDTIAIRARHHHGPDVVWSLRIDHEPKRLLFTDLGSAQSSVSANTGSDQWREVVAQAILQALREQGSLSHSKLRRDVSKRVGIGSDRCDRVLNELLKDGQVIEKAGERKARMFSAN